MARGRSSRNLILAITCLLLLAGGAAAYKYWPRPRHVKPAPKAKETDTALKVKEGDAVELPFILWGGDVATFIANGDFETKPDSIFARHGLKLKLVPGDDFAKQVENYLKGTCPFLRGTLSMLGQFSEELTRDPRTTPVVFLQLTWSAGDHLVARDPLKTLDDLKGKKIALQKGGPHVGMLQDILRTARLEWQDIQVVWTDDVTGDKGPAALFRKDAGLDACFAISPDMTDLTGGLEEKGTGQKTTVQGAHVLVSTAHMSRSIADVYAVRKDFFASNRELVEKVAAGYLKACEELVSVRKQAGMKDAEAGKRWDAIIQLTQAIYGKDPINAPAVKEKEAVEGLIEDAAFVGLPGNVAFFTNVGNLSGFNFKQRVALVLPADPAKEKLKENPREFLKAEFNYDALRKRGGLVGQATHKPRFDLGAEFKFETEKTIYYFTISFNPDQSTFPEQQYAQEFQRALEQASLFGNAAVAVRGHADPSLLTHMAIEAGKGKGLLKDGAGPDQYLLEDGSGLDLKNINKVLALIVNKNLVLPAESRLSGGRPQSLEEVVQGLKKLSDDRAQAALKAVTAYAAQRKLVLEESQMRSVGVGVVEPLVTYGKKPGETARNRRVEFRIIKVPSDKVNTEDFEL